MTTPVLAPCGKWMGLVPPFITVGSLPGPQKFPTVVLKSDYFKINSSFISVSQTEEYWDLRPLET